jgi:uncharacterized membrane protein
MVDLGSLQGRSSRANGISADCGTIVLGALKRGGLLPGSQAEEHISYAYAVSDDATVVVGISGRKPATDAFIWTPGTGIMKLSDYLKGKGVTGLDGWTLVGASALTPDGKTIGGTGINPSNHFEAWVVKLQ